MEKIVYIYALSKPETPEDFYYIGRSIRPKARNGKQDIVITILDKFVDREHKWINKMLNEGYNLTNKETFVHAESHEIGDVICLNPKSVSQKIKNIETGEVFNSMREAAKTTKWTEHYFLQKLKTGVLVDKWVKL